MGKYVIVISEEAEKDIDAIVEYIRNIVKEPETARRYHDGLINTILNISSYADVIGISQYDSIQRKYGPNARHFRYKKMTIIYVIDGYFVYIQQIIPSSLIY